jgi:quinol monooxygenase YgiN
MATLLAHITVNPGSEPEFERIARGLYEASHRLEPELEYYEYWRGEAERTYYALLAFADHRAWIAHQASDHHESASPALGPHIASIRLEFVDPVGGASPLPPTEFQPAPDNADELTATYTERFRAQVAQWWTELR